MDAKVGDWVVTPRIGKPVEVQALWYNALRIMEDFAKTFGDSADAARYGQMAEAAAVSFRRLFWNPQVGCLYDVVDGESRDASLRPNQIFAVILPQSLLDENHSYQIVVGFQCVILTNFRSLSR